MKKITASLGSSHSEFDRQLKDILNDIVDNLNNLTLTQQDIIGYQNKLFLQKHASIMESPLCDDCQKKATFTVINNNEGIYKFFCDSCLTH